MFSGTGVEGIGINGTVHTNIYGLQTSNEICPMLGYILYFLFITCLAVCFLWFSFNGIARFLGTWVE